MYVIFITEVTVEEAPSQIVSETVVTTTNTRKRKQDFVTIATPSGEFSGTVGDTAASVQVVENNPALPDNPSKPIARPKPQIVRPTRQRLVVPSSIDSTLSMEKFHQVRCDDMRG